MFVNNTLNPPVAATITSIVTPTVAPITVLASADNIAALGVASRLTDHVLVATSRFRAGGRRIRYSWWFEEIITIPTARVFNGTVARGNQRRHVRLIVANEKANDLISPLINGVRLDVNLVGAGCRFSDDQALRRVCRAIFRHKQSRLSHAA